MNCRVPSSTRSIFRRLAALAVDLDRVRAHHAAVLVVQHRPREVEREHDVDRSRVVVNVVAVLVVPELRVDGVREVGGVLAGSDVFRLRERAALIADVARLHPDVAGVVSRGVTRR